MIEEILANANVVYAIASGMVVAGVVKLVTMNSVVSEKVERFLPLVSFIVCFVAGLALLGITAETVVACILIGGAGSGIYDVVKKSVLGR